MQLFIYAVTIIAVGFFFEFTKTTEYAWKFLEGSQLGSRAGSGYDGSTSVSNYPGARYGAAYALDDSSTKMWLYGGFGCTDSNCASPGYLNDMWEGTLDIVSGKIEWKFRLKEYYSTRDNKKLNMPGYFSESRRREIDESGRRCFGWGDSNSYPSGRYGHTMNYADIQEESSDELWIFGGMGCTTSSSGVCDCLLDDLWHIKTNFELRKVFGGSCDSNGNYVSKGSWSGSSRPSGRKDHAAWFDEQANCGRREGGDCDKLAIFGGYGINPDSSGEGYLNDLWNFRPWDDDYFSRWDAGCDCLNAAETLSYTFSTSAVPSARAGSAHWTNGGYGYLYGGIGPSSTFLTDLWIIRLDDFYMRKASPSNYDCKYVDPYGVEQNDCSGLPATQFPPRTHLSVTFRDFSTSLKNFYFFAGKENANFKSHLWSFEVSDSVSETSTTTFKFHAYASKENDNEEPNYSTNFDGLGYPGSLQQAAGVHFPSGPSLFIVGGLSYNSVGGSEYSNNQFKIGLLDQTCNGYPKENSLACSDYPCLLDNTCDCGDGWGGDDCTVLPYDCYGLPNPSACSGTNGVCIEEDVCNCTANYGTPISYPQQDCSVHKCGGILSTEDSVCNFHGDCEDVNSCVCHSGYGPAGVCDEFVCSGILASQTDTVCSKHGNCDGPNHCTCTDDYEGEDCEYWKCYGVMYNHTLDVCSNHGSCDSPDYCNCGTGYSTPVEFTEHDCSIPICDEILDTDEAACNFHGTCESPDVCVCDPGYGPEGECTESICFGKSENVCSNHGSCDGPNQCTCTDDYEGGECHYWKCYDVMYNETDNVCSGGHGDCSSPENCTCYEGYRNNKCQDVICGDYDSSDGEVCNQHGDCNTPEYCTCWPGYGPPNDCSQEMCYEELIGSDNACSGNGECLGVNDCDCEDDYLGWNCEYWYCYNKIFNETDVTCSGNGDCSSPENCKCFEGYSEDECGTWYCGEYNQTQTDKVCTNHGKCDSPSHCDCDEGYYGDDSVSCTKWDCDNVVYTLFEACNSKGYCEKPDVCDCNDDYYGQFCGLYIPTGEFSFIRTDFLRARYTFKIGIISGIYSVKFKCFGEEGVYSEVLQKSEDNYELLGEEYEEMWCYWIVDNEDDEMVQYLEIELNEDNEIDWGSELTFMIINTAEDADVEDTFIKLMINNNGTFPEDLTGGDNGEESSNNIIPGAEFNGDWLYSLVVLVFFFSICIVCCCVYCLGCFCFLCCGCCVCCLSSGSCCSLSLCGLKLRKKNKALNTIVFGDDKDSKRMSKADFKFNIDLFQIKDSELKLQKVIGSGGSNSTIYLAKWKSRLVAVKIFRTNSLFDSETFDFEEFEREINILGSISHPNIINIYGCCIKPPRVCLVLEYAAKGDLKKYFYGNKDNFFSFQEKVSFMLQVCSAVEYLHEREIIHRDLKSENILLLEDLSPKLIDFGLSKVKDESKNLMTRKIGTSNYMAPEVIRGDYDESADIFSLAIISYEIFLENFDPYKSRIASLNTSSSIEYLVEKDPDFRPIVTEEFKNDYGQFKLEELMMKMWYHDPSVRPKINEVKEFYEKLLEKLEDNDEVKVTPKADQPLEEIEMDEVNPVEVT